MVENIKSDIKKRMGSAIDSLKGEFTSLRTGRAHANLLNAVVVDAYGSKLPLTQCANVSAKDTNVLLVSVWDNGLTSSVEKAIRAANLGLNPMCEGNVIRITVPQLTEERRRDMVKVAGQYAENSRVAIRNIRRDGINQLKKHNLPKDDEHRLQEDIQKITDNHIKTVDEILAVKEKEILRV